MKGWTHRAALFAVALAVAVGLFFLLRGRRGTEGNEASPAPELGIGMKLVRIAPGTFLMGMARADSEREKDEVPQRSASIQHGFWIGAYEVTQRQWKAVMGNNPSRFSGDDLPVENVSWDDVTAFCERLSQQSRHTVRLPTETEWEYACRAGSSTLYCFGDRLGPDQANFRTGEEEDSRGTTPVGQFAPNAWGLYDVHGNVWEWCAGEYKSGDGSSRGTLRVVRGGAWLFDERDSRSASRDGYPQRTRCAFVGFRVVVELGAHSYR